MNKKYYLQDTATCRTIYASTNFKAWTVIIGIHQILYIFLTCFIFSTKRQILLNPAYNMLQNILICIGLVDFCFNLTVERMVDGFVVRKFRDSAMIYFKSWFLIDILAIGSQIESLWRYNSQCSKIINSNFLKPQYLGTEGQS